MCQGAPATVTARARADITVSLLEEIFERRRGRVRPLLRLILSHLRAAVYRHAGGTGPAGHTHYLDGETTDDGVHAEKTRDGLEQEESSSASGEGIALQLAREILALREGDVEGSLSGATATSSQEPSSLGQSRQMMTDASRVAAASLKGRSRAERLRSKQQVIVALTRQLVRRRIEDEEQGRTDGSYIAEVARLENEKVESRRRVRELEEGNSALSKVMGRTRKLVDATALRWQKTIRQHYFRYWRAFTARRRDQMRRINAMVMRHGRAGRLRTAFDALRIGTRQLRAERAERDMQEREREANEMESRNHSIGSQSERTQSAAAELADRIRASNALGQQLKGQLQALHARVERQPANQLRAVGRAWAEVSMRGIGRKLDRVCGWLLGDLSGLRGAGRLDFPLGLRTQPSGGSTRGHGTSGADVRSPNTRKKPVTAATYGTLSTTPPPGTTSEPSTWPDYGRGLPGECDAYRPPEDTPLWPGSDLGLDTVVNPLLLLTPSELEESHRRAAVEMVRQQRDREDAKEFLRKGGVPGVPHSGSAAADRGDERVPDLVYDDSPLPPLPALEHAALQVLVELPLDALVLRWMNHQLLDGNRVSHGLFDLRAYAGSQSEAMPPDAPSGDSPRKLQKRHAGLTASDAAGTLESGDEDDDGIAAGDIAGQKSMARHDTGIELRHSRAISLALQFARAVDEIDSVGVSAGGDAIGEDGAEAGSLSFGGGGSTLGDSVQASAADVKQGTSPKTVGSPIVSTPPSASRMSSRGGTGRAQRSVVRARASQRTGRARSAARTVTPQRRGRGQTSVREARSGSPLHVPGAAEQKRDGSEVNPLPILKAGAAIRADQRRAVVENLSTDLDAPALALLTHRLSITADRQREDIILRLLAPAALHGGQEHGRTAPVSASVVKQLLAGDELAWIRADPPDPTRRVRKAVLDRIELARAENKRIKSEQPLADRESSRETPVARRQDTSPMRPNRGIAPKAQHSSARISGGKASSLGSGAAISRVPFSSPGTGRVRADGKAIAKGDKRPESKDMREAGLYLQFPSYALPRQLDEDSIHPQEDLNDVAEFLRSMRDEGRAMPFLPAALRHIRAKSQAEENLARLRQLGLPDGILTVAHMLQHGALSSSAYMIAMCFLMCSRPELAAPLRFQSRAHRHAIMHPYHSATLRAYGYIASIEADLTIDEVVLKSDIGDDRSGSKQAGRLHISVPRANIESPKAVASTRHLPAVQLPIRGRDSHISPGLRDPAALPVLQVRVPLETRPDYLGPDSMLRLFGHREAAVGAGDMVQRLQGVLAADPDPLLAAPATFARVARAAFQLRLEWLDVVRTWKSISSPAIEVRSSDLSGDEEGQNGRGITRRIHPLKPSCMNQSSLTAMGECVALLEGVVLRAVRARAARRNMWVRLRTHIQQAAWAAMRRRIARVPVPVSDRKEVRLVRAFTVQPLASVRALLALSRLSQNQMHSILARAGGWWAPVSVDGATATAMGIDVAELYRRQERRQELLQDGSQQFAIEKGLPLVVGENNTILFAPTISLRGQRRGTRASSLQRGGVTRQAMDALSRDPALPKALDRGRGKGAPPPAAFFEGIVRRLHKKGVRDGLAELLMFYCSDLRRVFDHYAATSRGGSDARMDFGEFLEFARDSRLMCRSERDSEAFTWSSSADSGDAGAGKGAGQPSEMAVLRAATAGRASMTAVTEQAAQIAKAARKAKLQDGSARGSGAGTAAPRTRMGGAGMGKTTFMRSSAGRSTVVGRGAGSQEWRLPDEIEVGLTRQDLRGVFLASCPSSVASSIIKASAAVQDSTFVGSYELSPGEFGSALLRAAVVFCGKYRCSLASREIREQADAAVSKAESLGLRPESTTRGDPRRLPFFRLPSPEFEGPAQRQEQVGDDDEPALGVNQSLKSFLGSLVSPPSASSSVGSLLAPADAATPEAKGHRRLSVSSLIPQKPLLSLAAGQGAPPIPSVVWHATADPCIAFCVVMRWFVLRHAAMEPDTQWAAHVRDDAVREVMSRLRPFLHAVYIYYARTRIEINEKARLAQIERSMGGSSAGPISDASTRLADGQLASGAMTVEDLLRMLVRDCQVVSKHTGKQPHGMGSGISRAGSRRHPKGQGEASQKSVPVHDLLWTVARALGANASFESDRGAYSNLTFASRTLAIRPAAGAAEHDRGLDTGTRTELVSSRNGRRGAQKHLSRGLSMLATGSSSEGARQPSPRHQRASVHVASRERDRVGPSAGVLRRGAHSSRNVIRFSMGGSESDFTDGDDMSSDSDSSSVDEEPAQQPGHSVPVAGGAGRELGPRRSSSRDMGKPQPPRRGRATDFPVLPVCMKMDVLTHLFTKEDRAGIERDRESAQRILQQQQARQQASASGGVDGAASTSVASSAASAYGAPRTSAGYDAEAQQSLFASSAAAQAARRSSMRRGSTAGLESRDVATSRRRRAVNGSGSGGGGLRKAEQDDRDVFESVGKSTDLPYTKFIEILMALAHVSSPDPYVHPAHKLEAFLVRGILHSYVFKLAQEGASADWQMKLERAKEGGETQTSIRAIFAGSSRKQGKRRFKYSGAYEDVLRLLPKEAASGVGMRIEATPVRAPPSNVGRWWQVQASWRRLLKSMR